MKTFSFKKLLIWSFIFTIAISYFSYVPKAKAGAMGFCGPGTASLGIIVMDIDDGLSPHQDWNLPVAYIPENPKSGLDHDFAAVIDATLEIPTGHRVQIEVSPSISVGMYDNEDIAYQYLPNASGQMVYGDFYVTQPNPDGGNATGSTTIITGPIQSSVGDGFFQLQHSVTGCEGGPGDFPMNVWTYSSSTMYAHIEFVPYEPPGGADIGQINVTSNDPSGSWTLSGPANLVWDNGTSIQGSGSSAPYGGLVMGDYTISGGTIECKLLSITDDSGDANDQKITLSQNGDLKTFTLTYSDDPNCGPTPEPGINPTADIKANGSDSPDPIPYGTSASITWSSTNATSCAVTPGNWTGTSEDVGKDTGAITSPTTYSIDCAGGEGTIDATDSVTVSPGPIPTSSIKCDSADWNANCTIDYNSSIPITWQSSEATACTVKKNSSNWDSGTSGTKTDTLTANTTYTLTCSAPASAPADKTINVYVRTPTVDLKGKMHGQSDAQYSDGPITFPNWEAAQHSDACILKWTSTNANSCTASGDWSGAKSTSGTQGVGPLSEPKTYTYTLTCLGSTTVSDQVPCIVPDPVPTVLPPAGSGDGSIGNGGEGPVATPPDYCQSGPVATVAWGYTDPSGSPESAYQVQIAQNGNFANLAVDSGKVHIAATSYVGGLGVLQFNKTYQARVRVWNGYDQMSEWATTNSWTTPGQAYPDVNFSLSPAKPEVNKKAQFTDLTTFADGSGHSWLWTFGDGTVSTAQNPSHIYTTAGNYNLSLKTTDGLGHVCTKTGSALVQKAIPIWKEVAPR